jgi:hypothetical protein
MHASVRERWRTGPRRGPMTRYARPIATVMVFAIVFILGAVESRGVARFGTRCQAEYQNDWQNELPYMWNRCGWFVDELDDTDTSVFYFNLHGSRTKYSTCDGCSTGVDAVSLMYTGTHGGAKDRDDVVLAMWNDGSLAASVADAWRLGDEATGTSFMAMYSCETLSNGDSNAAMKNRWRATFRGGLRIALGSHDKLYDGITTDEVGEDFADDLQDGKSAKWAWFDANGDWATDQDVRVLATGTGSSNCASRRDGIKWQNFTSFNRLRDGNLAWWCWSTIDNN